MTDKAMELIFDSAFETEAPYLIVTYGSGKLCSRHTAMQQQRITPRHGQTALMADAADRVEATQRFGVCCWSNETQADQP